MVAVLGEANVGKSTLINALVGHKVSIVSPKVQTTRQRIMGILCHNNTQIVFVDTPGLFTTENPTLLEKRMVRNVWQASREADVLMIMLDVNVSYEYNEGILDRLWKEALPIIVVWNKVDRLKDKSELFEMTAKIREKYPLVRDVLMISALKHEGLEQVMPMLENFCRDGSWLYPEDQWTSSPLRTWSSEITREQLYLLLKHELPYETYIETERFKENSHKCKVYQSIVVAKESQKPIIIGKQGSMLKMIGQRARQELKKQLGIPVQLFLFVKVKSDWMANSSILDAIDI